MYADDLLLIAPTRGAMQLMLEVCENYAKTFNISFSTDPNPAKSKSKCIFMVGKSKNVTKPAALLLEGRELPWVESATHLGHELHQSGTMEHDAKIKRESSSVAQWKLEKHLDLLPQWKFKEL